MATIEKAIAITDAKISFVSLVDKAANKTQFLITKAKEGEAAFTTRGLIVKTDKEKHYVTGIVYEPMVEDAHGNFMTEEEIQKAAYGYAKSGYQCDLQHEFEPMEGACVVESWIEKSDCTIGDSDIKKGTWLMTVEITDPDIWDKVEKGELTGFSMGGVGKYSNEDVDITNEQAGLFKRFAAALGFNVVEKGMVADNFKERSRRVLFDEAFRTLQDAIYPWYGGQLVEEDVLETALKDFNDIITKVLSAKGGVFKALEADEPVEKAGKKISSLNRSILQEAYDNIGQILADTEEKPKEDDDEMTDETKNEVQKMIDEAIAKAVTEAQNTEPAPAPQAEGENEVITKADVAQMVAEAVKAATQPEDNDEVITKENLADTISAEVAKAVEPILAQRGLATNLNNETEPVNKSDNQHYMAGMFD